MMSMELDKVSDNLGATYGSKSPPGFEISVLSMPTSHDRRRRITQLMADAGIENWHFFEPVPASSSPLPYDDERAFARYGSALSRAEISCAASHIFIMRRFLDRGDLHHLIVLEDDVHFEDTVDFSQYVRLMSILDLDYLKLYARFLVNTRFVLHMGRSILYRFMYPPLGTQGYILSRAGAKRMLDRFDEHGCIDMPIDQLMDRLTPRSLPIFTVYPFPVMELNVPTTIHNAENLTEKETKNAKLAIKNKKPKEMSFSSRLDRKLHNLKADREGKRLLDRISRHGDDLSKLKF